MSRSIMILAGEASGDQHAAHLVEKLRQRHPDWEFFGMGSSAMRKTGVELVFDSASIAVMGLVEVLKHWGDIKKAMKIVRESISTRRPDLLLCIDYQEFNQKMARHAKEQGIRVLFYVSPQVWAWRPHRIHKIGKIIDHMAVIFPFETRLYEQAGVPVTYVGHPLSGKVKAQHTQAEVRQQLGLNEAQAVVGLLPGSRINEVKRLIPLLLETAQLLKQQHPEMAFIVPMAQQLDESYFAELQSDAARALDIHTSRENIYDLTTACDAVLACSGTVTLEIALLKVPLCVVYKLSGLSYQIMSRMITIPYVSLANIVAEKGIVKELLQQDATAENCSAEMEKLLFDQSYRNTQIAALETIEQKLGQLDGIEALAKVVEKETDTLTPP